MVKRMKKTCIKVLKNLAVIVGIIVVIAGVFNFCVYKFSFESNFGRSKKERTVEHEIEFYASEENYNRHIADVKYIESLRLPLIEMDSYDSIKLRAILWESPEPARGSILLMHGFHSGPLREFATLAIFFHELGFNVIMPYQRAHGLSDGSFLTFGVKERFDCRDWALKINELYGQDKPLFIGGISMGCATVTMASGLDLPLNVRGIIADCGFTEPYEITRWTATNIMNVWPGVADVLIASTNWYCNHVAGFDLKEYSTYKALNKTDLPFLFITGTNDKTVPYEMTMTNFMLYKQRHPDRTKLVLFEDAPHAISYLMDENKYKAEVKKFIEKYE